MRRLTFTIICLAVAFLCGLNNGAAAQTAPTIVQPGDTWTALALRYNVPESELRALNPHFNRARQPAIGRPLNLPDGALERTGHLVRPGLESLLPAAIRYGLSPWTIAEMNGLASPYRPNLYRPLLLPGNETIRDLPPGIETIELSTVVAEPGQALGIRGTSVEEEPLIIAQLDDLPITFATNENRFAGVTGTGGFFAGGEPELMIRVGDSPAWVQPWAFAEREWEYQELTLTGTAAEIDQQARDEERARLREIWTKISAAPLWTTDFITPIADFLGVSANYGARRSYNGGPYLTYHEGVDYSAYAGTPVFAPAAGTVALAEPLYVRGGTVIIDHGLGVFSGYYHLSKVHATPGQEVGPGDLLGEVGTTGLSTGNHLHWDLLVNGNWVDAATWQQQGLACWLLAGLGAGCAATDTAE